MYTAARSIRRVGSFGHGMFNIVEILETGFKKLEREASSLLFSNLGSSRNNVESKNKHEKT